MSESLSFYAVRKDALADAPVAVQNFVEDFFAEMDVFGTACFVAAGTDYKAPWIDMADEDYEEGLSDEELADYGVFTWFDNHPEAVFKYDWS